ERAVRIDDLGARSADVERDGLVVCQVRHCGACAPGDAKDCRAGHRVNRPPDDELIEVYKVDADRETAERSGERWALSGDVWVVCLKKHRGGCEPLARAGRDG